MDVGMSFVAHAQTPIPREPCEGPFDHPAVSPQALLGLDADAGDSS
jgi:hypothetical protein